MRFDPDHLIINYPELAPPSQKFTAMGITLFFWGALLYLWQPLLSIIAWGFNIQLFYNHMILMGGYKAFLQLLTGYLQVIGLLGGGLILWARINQWRFRGSDRRRHLGNTDMQKMQQEFGISADVLDTMKNSRIVKISINAEGKLSHVELVSRSQNDAVLIASPDCVS